MRHSESVLPHGWRVKFSVIKRFSTGSVRQTPFLIPEAFIGRTDGALISK